jgi:hypothetical protein
MVCAGYFKFKNSTGGKMKKAVATLMITALAGAFNPAIAQERREFDELRSTTYELINLLVDEGILSRAKADLLIREANRRTEEAKQKAVESKATESKVVRVPYVPQTVRDQIRDEIKQDIVAEAKASGWGNPGALPEWMDRISFEGDIRLRYQGDRYPPDNAPAFAFPAGQDITNTTEDRDRFAVRARLGMKLKFSDWLTGGMRLTTGNTTTPVSTNQTLGNSFNKYSMVLDQAYVRADPTEWLTISGGRIPNPWFSTELVWDEDVNFDGVAATYKPRFNESVNGFLTVGAFPLQEVSDSTTTLAKDKWLVGVQGGMAWNLPHNSNVKVGLALYNFKNIEGIRNTGATTFYDLTAPQFRQKGNSLFDITGLGTGALYGLTANFKELNLTAAYDIARFDPVHVVLTGDFVKNIGYDSAEISQRTGLAAPDPETKGYYTRVMVGMPRLRSQGDWQAHLGYKYLERDAVVDAYTDSDFHLGGTNAKGFIIGGSYGLGSNSWMSLRWMSSTQISGAPLSIDVMQLDFNARF